MLFYCFQKKQLQKSEVPFWSLLFWLGMAFIGANASASLFGHQLKQAILPIALVAGLGIDSFARMLGSFAPRVLAWLYLSLVMALFPFGNVMMTGHWLLSWQLLHPEKTAASTSPRVVKYIQSQTDPLDYVLFWRPKSCREVWYSQRRCPSKYFNTCFQYMPDFESCVAADAAARPPKLIVVNKDINTPLPSGLRSLLTKDYSPSGEIDYYQIFCRNETGKKRK